MAERVTIRIEPSDLESDTLSVSDAMRQVLDFVELLHAVDEDHGGKNIVWRLVSASMNSPFEVVAEAASRDPSIVVSVEASRTKKIVSETLLALTEAGEVPTWVEPDYKPILERMFERNSKSIGETRFGLSDKVGPIVVNQPKARRAALLIEQDRITTALKVEDKTRTEYGSIEGDVIENITHYGSPAITLRHRLSGLPVRCVLSVELAKKIGPSHSWWETWNGNRVIVTGELHFDKS
ncbi:MAG: hypothetical protein KAG97_13635, partial [Victivallales bacterium]|nr:hypothetical protein [Victivallales bacterium]